MQYILGLKSVIVLSLPEHRSHDDLHDGKIWSHVNTDEVIVLYQAPKHMTFLTPTITQIVAEAGSVNDMIRNLETVNSIDGVKIHVIYVDYRDQPRGRNEETGDTWLRYYSVYHQKVNDKGKFERYSCDFSRGRLHDFETAYDVPEYMVQYLDRRTYEAIRNSPGDESPNYDECDDIARSIIRRECMDHMLNPHFNELFLVIPAEEEIVVPHGTKPKNHKDFFNV